MWNKSLYHIASFRTTLSVTVLNMNIKMWKSFELEWRLNSIPVFSISNRGNWSRNRRQLFPSIAINYIFVKFYILQSLEENSWQIHQRYTPNDNTVFTHLYIERRKRTKSKKTMRGWCGNRDNHNKEKKKNF